METAHSEVLFYTLPRRCKSQANHRNRWHMQALQQNI
jgi:hypothetical protein